MSDYRRYQIAPRTDEDGEITCKVSLLLEDGSEILLQHGIPVREALDLLGIEIYHSRKAS